MDLKGHVLTLNGLRDVYSLRVLDSRLEERSQAFWAYFNSSVEDHGQVACCRCFWTQKIIFRNVIHTLLNLQIIYCFVELPGTQEALNSKTAITRRVCAIQKKYFRHALPDWSTSFDFQTE